METDILKKIDDRLIALEIVHTRYRGPEGKRGEQGPAGRDGTPGKDVTLEERNAFREELNNFREDLNTFRRESYGFHKQLREELDRAHREYVEELSSVYCKEVEAFCEKRDSFCEEPFTKFRQEMTAL